MWTVNEFKEQMERKVFGTYIVRIILKYDYEVNFREITTIATITPDKIEWLDDWNEGEDCVFVLGYIWIDDIYRIAHALIDFKLSGNIDNEFSKAIKTAKEFLGIQ